MKRLDEMARAHALRIVKISEEDPYRTAMSVGADALSVGSALGPGMFLARIGQRAGLPPMVAGAAAPLYALGRGLWRTANARELGAGGTQPLPVKPSDIAEAGLEGVANAGIWSGLGWAAGERPTFKGMGVSLALGGAVALGDRLSRYMAQKAAYDQYLDRMTTPSTPPLPAAVDLFRPKTSQAWPTVKHSANKLTKMFGGLKDATKLRVGAEGESLLSIRARMAERPMVRPELTNLRNRAAGHIVRKGEYVDRMGRTPFVNDGSWGHSRGSMLDLDGLSARTAPYLDRNQWAGVVARDPKSWGQMNVPTRARVVRDTLDSTKPVSLALHHPTDLGPHAHSALTHELSERKTGLLSAARENAAVANDPRSLLAVARAPKGPRVGTAHTEADMWAGRSWDADAIGNLYPGQIPAEVAGQTTLLQAARNRISTTGLTGHETVDPWLAERAMGRTPGVDELDALRSSGGNNPARGGYGSMHTAIQKQWDRYGRPVPDSRGARKLQRWWESYGASLPKQSGGEPPKLRDRVEVFVFDKHGDVLTGKIDGRYVFPGGGRDGDGINAAAKKELREEVGIDIKNVNPTGQYPKATLWPSDFQRQQRTRGRHFKGERTAWRWGEVARWNSAELGSEGDALPGRAFRSVEEVIDQLGDRAVSPSNEFKDADQRRIDALSSAHRRWKTSAAIGGSSMSAMADVWAREHAKTSANPLRAIGNFVGDAWKGAKELPTGFRRGWQGGRGARGIGGVTNRLIDTVRGAGREFNVGYHTNRLVRGTQDYLGATARYRNPGGRMWLDVPKSQVDPEQLRRLEGGMRNAARSEFEEARWLARPTVQQRNPVWDARRAQAKQDASSHVDELARRMQRARQADVAAGYDTAAKYNNGVGVQRFGESYIIGEPVPRWLPDSAGTDFFRGKMDRPLPMPGAPRAPNPWPNTQLSFQTSPGSFNVALPWKVEGGVTFEAMRRPGSPPRPATPTPAPAPRATAPQAQARFAYNGPPIEPPPVRRRVATMNEMAEPPRPQDAVQGEGTQPTLPALRAMKKSHARPSVKRSMSPLSKALVAGGVAGGGVLYFNPFDEDDLIDMYNGKDSQWGFEGEPNFRRAGMAAAFGGGLSGTISGVEHVMKKKQAELPLINKAPAVGKARGLAADAANSLLVEPLMNVPLSAARLAAWPFVAGGILATQGPAAVLDLPSPVGYVTRKRHMFQRDPHIPLRVAAAVAALGGGAYLGKRYLDEHPDAIDKAKAWTSERVARPTLKKEASVPGLVRGAWGALREAVAPVSRAVTRAVQPVARAGQTAAQAGRTAGHAVLGAGLHQAPRATMLAGDLAADAMTSADPYFAYTMASRAAEGLVNYGGQTAGRMGEGLQYLRGGRQVGAGIPNMLPPQRAIGNMRPQRVPLPVSKAPKAVAPQGGYAASKKSAPSVFSKNTPGTLGTMRPGNTPGSSAKSRGQGGLSTSGGPKGTRPPGSYLSQNGVDGVVKDLAKNTIPVAPPPASSFGKTPGKMGKAPTPNAPSAKVAPAPFVPAVKAIGPLSTVPPPPKRPTIKHAAVAPGGPFAGLMGGVGQVIKAPFKASPVATGLGALGLGAYGVHTYVGQPVRAMAGDARARIEPQFAQLYRTLHEGSGSARPAVQRFPGAVGDFGYGQTYNIPQG